MICWFSKLAWLNAFWRSWFVPAVELVQADRLRQKTMEHMAKVFESVDVYYSVQGLRGCCC
ncbi:MAG: hypothetical protein M2R45_01964 [Verrucomicrobia subdivision 3 bacterium]|nr:hypothetical protein [Limisphaerales bacterium]MCS1416169.1 hypothetical protein [Limisphaerales bacterium]